MSNKQWTTEQLAAINERDANILVSAAAGAGKTAVLVERLIKRITDPADPVSVDKILVVTFTNAAAQEMKERIGTALAKRAEADPSNSYLTEQYLLLNKAAISTLHSFCLDCIRQYYYLLELPAGLALDPGFRVGDETETTLLRLEVLDELFEEKYLEEDPLFLQLVECFGGQKDDLGLQNLLLKLYNFARSQKNPEGWLKSVAQPFTEIADPSYANKYFAYLTGSFCDQLADALVDLEEAARIAALPGGPAVYIKLIQEEIVELREVIDLSEKGWLAIFGAFKEFDFSRLSPCKGDFDQDLKEKAQNLRNRAKEIIKDLKKKYLARIPKDMLLDMQELGPLMEYLCRLVLEYDQHYLKAKLTKNMIDFSDIEHLALKLLTMEISESTIPSPLAEKIQEQYHEVLIDEYQDINGVQEAILEAVARNSALSSNSPISPNMFMVGDVKQSIYGFRLADPGLFLSKYHKYQLKSQEEECLEKKIHLSKNFRSRPDILNGINYIFRQLMTAQLGGLVYDEQAELVCGTKYPALLETEGRGLADFPIEFHLIDRQPKSEEREDAAVEDEEPDISAEELDSLQVEARLAVQRIEELKNSLVWDKDLQEYRPATYRDMVVILRTTKGTADVFLEEFGKAGIPAYAEIGGGYLIAQEIVLVLSLLQIIDNPRQDLPLAAVLRSTIGGFNSSQLARIRLRRPRGDFYDALRLAGQKEEGELGDRIRQFLIQLKHWRTYARHHTLSDLIRLLYRETGYYTYVGALPGGPQRQANLRSLQDRARQYEQTTLRGLFKFLRFLAQLEERQGDLGVARALGEKEDVLRIMSVHKSKGLEFPIVILAGLGKRFNLQDLREDVLIDKELGLGPYRILPQERLKYPTLARLAIKEKLRRSSLAEECRILYVAMTRAREALIMIGTARNLTQRMERWEMGIQQHEWALPTGLANGAGCYLDWLVPAILRHKEGETISSRNANLTKELADNPCYNDCSRWKLKLWNGPLPRVSEASQDSQYATELAKIKGLDILNGSDLALEIERRLNWQYPGRKWTTIPAKLSVSELKNRYRQMVQDPSSAEAVSHYREYNRRPRFLLEKKGLAAAEIGSALHLVMRYLDLQKVNTLSDIVSQLELMVVQEKLTTQQRQTIDPKVINHFFLQPIGQRLLNSKRVMREVPFTLGLSPQELFPLIGEVAEEKIILQGTLDCLFADGDGYILLDYKSDAITARSVEAFKERYRLQLDLYAQAVETILKVSVKERILYSFQLGEAFTL